MTKQTIKNTLLCAAATALALSATTAAYAGRHWGMDVKVNQGGWAQGVLSTARNSADSVQYLGCQVFVTKGLPPAIYCFASDADRQTVGCYSEDPTFVTVAGALNGDSFLEFYADEGICTDLIVWNSSELEPKQ